MNSYPVIVLQIKNKFIKKGVPGFGGNCPIALAAQDHFKAYKCVAGKDGVYVTMKCGDRRFKLRPLGTYHKDFIQKFDRYLPVKTCKLTYVKI